MQIQPLTNTRKEENKALNIKLMGKLSTLDNLEE